MGKHNFLILGWQVDQVGNPRYWLTDGAQLGKQSDYDLVRVPADSMDTHTVIIAQSGSGKSFFLGRLVEELLLRTKARCLILDPSGDFRRVSEIDEKIWGNHTYNIATGKGKLTHEPRGDFVTSFSAVTKRIRSRNYQTKKLFQPLKIFWPVVSVEFLLGHNPNPVIQSELYQCHTFVQNVVKILILDSFTRNNHTEQTIFEEAERLYEKGDKMGKEAFEKELLATYGAKQANQQMGEDFRNSIFFSLLNFTSSPDIMIKEYAKKAATALPYFHPETAKFYFAKLSEYRAEGIIEVGLEASRGETPRLDVVDLASIQDRTIRSMVTSAVLAEEWQRALSSWNKAIENDQDKDTRVPTFVILDEAHNFIPAEPRDASEIVLREQFRTIAAEGRKYGLFLILVSQRPDKLDHIILSECGNKAIMKLDSHAIVNTVSERLGFDDRTSRMLEEALDFKPGRVLLSGRWAIMPQVLYTAARRTVEGGRNLRPEYWARPYEKAMQEPKMSG